MKLFKIVFSLIIISSILFSQEINKTQIEKYHSEVKNIVKYAVEREEGYKLLKEFCKFGPRLSGSENSMKAILWTEKKMKEMGFDNVTLQPVMVPKWVRGNLEECIISKSKLLKGKKLSIASLGGSVPTPKAGVEAEVVEVHSFEELRTLGDKVKGKIVFYNRPLEKAEIDPFSAYGKAVDQRSAGAINASKQEAVAVIVRSVTAKHDNSPHLGSVNYSGDVKKIPAVAIGLIDADMLSDAIKKDPHMKVKMRLDCKTYPDVLSYNLYCDIKGSLYPDEVIIAVGHSDSWDAGHGAHDDAAGCMHALEALNLIKATNLKPKRTLRCGFIINEENGLRGGIEYGKYSDTAKVKHIAALESDRGAGTPKGFTTTADSLKLAKMVSWLPILYKTGIEWIKPGGGGADISRIKSNVLIGFTPEFQKYFDYHHSKNDVISEVHPREFELGAAAIASLIYLISEEGL